MAMSNDPRERLLKAIREDGRYPPEAYQFLHDGLEFTTRRTFGDEEGDEPRHVTGQQLAEGLRDLALQRWGALARVVLQSWNVRQTRDFGEMVYFLIGLGMMGKQESDSIADFDEVYDFSDAFGSYRIPLEGRGS